MEKVLVIIPDNNKGKYISKGFSYAFKELSYYVSEKKIYDLNRDEIKSYSPDIIFSFWSDITQNSELKDFINNYNDEKTVLIHYAEAMKDIPADYKDKKNNYCFSYDGQKKQHTMPAVNVKDYKRKFTGYKYLITFAGNPAYKNRELILSKLIYNFGIINIFCRSYDFYKSVDEIYKSKLLNDKYIDLYRESYRGYVEKQTELAYIYSSTKVNLDLENPNKKSVNYRCMEILASGGFLISKYNNSIIKYFDDGKELETYRTDSELIDKIRFYLQNANLAQLIASKGRKNVATNHSFYDRLKVMLKGIYGKDSGNR